jgi:hypothetical protein
LMAPRSTLTISIRSMGISSASPSGGQVGIVAISLVAVCRGH